MNISSSSTPAHERALVLGGGGATGNAWLIGVIAGLFEAGIDVTSPDLTIGTSAGSTAAAQLGTASPAELYAAALAPIPPRSAPSGGAPARPAVSGLQRLTDLIAVSEDAADYRRRLSAAALAQDPADHGAWTERWRAIVGQRLPHATWPERAVAITALDAHTGEGVVFDRGSGVGLVDAVAASTSSGLPYRIGDGLFLDGGFRSNAENADLAAGYARVLVLAPFGGRSLAPDAWGIRLADQVDALRAGGSAVETIFPESEELFGENATDVTLRPAAARAGYEVGRARADDLVPFWD
ncbi:patatin-like phospholipase family protein [Leifsonia sp. F6_8S_P_1B]|uniref:Patatin-like phospholipase family protein n=1 Tax=Leifsonia williamsii TaxID=3035919 RepID=A0ABT8KEG8_9MICO|nr:patatin-like phospholipase family protein [Leifsonia williamsii]MDN4615388.1 patatin-like phospholipase family protein [Leifsonia williamsii]